MPSEPNIGNREREILTAIVETFISTGEPVGSRTLARSNREGLSPASIRNVMADLSDSGYLEQPHASAGRVPTPEAYRYYVEQLTGNARLAPQELAPREEAMISESLAGISDVQEFMERTSRVLSLISRNVGVAVATTNGPNNALEHVYFSRLGDQKVLAVVVSRSGLVRDRVCGWICRRTIWIWRRATSTRISVAGRWNRCAPSWPAASSRSAARPTG